MAERIPASTAIRIPLQAYLASDHFSPATGKTIAITISKNGAAYGNPSAGATNAVEIANGSYYVDISATDTGTTGPLFVRGAVATVDDVISIYNVVAATNGGFTALPAAAADAAGGLPISDAGGLDLDLRLDAAITSRMATYAQPTGFLAATFPSGTVANTTNITAGTIATVTNLTNAPTVGDLTAAMKTSVTTAATAATPVAASVTGNVGGNVTGSVGSVVGAVGSVAAGGIVAASFAAGALDAVWSTTVRLLTAGTNIVLAKGAGVTGFNDLDAAGVRSAVGLALANLDTQLAAIDVDVLTRSTYAGGAVASVTGSVAGSVGSVIGLTAANLDVAVSTRLATAGYASPPPAAAVADAVWDEVLASHLTAGSMGAALGAAGAAGDPWITPLPGGYAAGTAGYIIGGSTGSPNQIADALLDRVDGVETGWTLRQTMRITLSVMAGNQLGMSSSDITFRDVNNTKNRIVSSVAGETKTVITNAT